MNSLPSSTPRWDIFCAVVDNFGDIGVCWRLARQLAVEHGVAVRLWIDDFDSACRLLPTARPGTEVQRVDQVEIRHWTTPLPDVQPGDVVIAAFACDLPVQFLEAMARCTPRPVWINLEYLSAEDWVAGCHRLPSPHPRLPLRQYFFFPGLDRTTGGLLREADYADRRARFVAADFWRALDLPPPAPDELRVSLFCYENPALGELLDLWRQGSAPVTCLVPEGRVLPGVARAFGLSDLRSGDRLVRDALRVQVLPFVAQPCYDELLWACHLNFVRGEDSFVRAQWAEHPFVWHIYPQQDEAHLEKLEAFLARYRVGLDPLAARQLTDFWQAWNRGQGVAQAWPAFREALPALARHGKAWSASLMEAGDLARNLVQFCKDEI
ncbi:elongation factor P maturation arginine rhamnosyltransferase EarP [Zoogloea sp.]|uniref:elongation factor P maturation arginine rhamnosyltransferase EarP n=1 Tax=Zoogloea sp. TaxID=49181 RepID=UPI0035B0D1BE